MINIMDLFVILFYIALIVLIVILIIFGIKAIKTLNKVDKVVDDISNKSSKLDGVFNIIDTTTDAVVGVSDVIISLITNGVEKIFNRKKESKDE